MWVILISLKVKFSLCFNWTPRHESVLCEWRYSSTHFLTSALDEVGWSASRPRRFTPRERSSDAHLIGGWVGPRSGLDAVAYLVLLTKSLSYTYVKIKLKAPCLAKYHAVKTYCERRDLAPLILNLGTRWLVVRIKLRPLYLQRHAT